MDFYKYKMQMPNGLATTAGPESTIQLEMQRMQLELQRRDSLIDEQQKRIYHLEEELKRCNKQIQDLVVQLSNLKDQKKNESSYKAAQSRYWTAEEHDRFLDAVKRYGSKDVKAIANYVGTRNPTQVRTHAQKYYLRLERERKRREDEGKGIKREDSDMKSDEESSTSPPPSPNSPSHAGEESKDSSNTSPSPSPNDTSVPTSSNSTADAPSTSSEGQAKKTRKRGSAAGRRASLPVDMNTGPRPTESPSPSPTVVHSTRQQLQAAAPIVSSLKGWTPQEYNAFIEGLLSFPEEKDINRKCKLISEKFLPKYTPEDIKQCYAILHNYVRNKESVVPEESTATTFLNEAKRPRIDNPMPHGFTAPTYTTTAMPPSPDMVNLRYTHNYPYQVRSYPYANPYNGMPMNPAYAAMNDPAYQYAMGGTNAAYSGPDAAMIRRASYPMDAFSASKASEYPEYQETVFPAEIPTNWGTSSDTSNSTTGPSSSTSTEEPSHDSQRGNNL